MSEEKVSLPYRTGTKKVTKDSHRSMHDIPSAMI
jgi:hypothetical protein